MDHDKATEKRETIFISKATPGDDEFVLWLAPRLEAAGYTVFADILSLEPGDRWRKQVTGTLQNKAVKMLLCCRDSTLEKHGVQEEIGIAEDLVKELRDSRFIIPLRLEKFKKVFGIGELQWVDFVGSWASGLRDLLDTLERQGVPRSTGKIAINPSWENYKKRLAIKIEEAPETLTTNWLRIVSVPENIRYYQPPGAIDHSLMQRTCSEGPFPAEVYLRGLPSRGDSHSP
jgi:TIR domain-containing protein